jgi:hypothetical protein
MTLKDIKRLYVNLGQDTVITDKRYFMKITSNYLYIQYRHYGSSAIKHRLKDFIWLMKTIFKDYQAKDILLIDRIQYEDLERQYMDNILKAYYHQ